MVVVKHKYLFETKNTTRVTRLLSVAGKTICHKLIWHYLPHPLHGATLDSKYIIGWLGNIILMEVPGSFFNFQTD